MLTYWTGVVSPGCFQSAPGLGVQLWLRHACKVSPGPSCRVVLHSWLMVTPTSQSQDGPKINTGTHCQLLITQPLLGDAAFSFAGFVPLITSLSCLEQLNDSLVALPHNEKGQAPRAFHGLWAKYFTFIKILTWLWPISQGHIQFAKVVEGEKVRETAAFK